MRINTQNQAEIQRYNLNQKNVKASCQKFQGAGNLLTNILTVCDAHPMVGVSVIDGATSIVPRTIVDAQTHRYAALETFRRESSGLIVNCLLPSFIVMGVAKLAQNAVLGDEFKHLKLANIWANQDSIETLSSKFTEAGKNLKQGSAEHVKNYVKSVLDSVEGFDTNNYKNFSHFDLSGEIDTLAKCITEKTPNAGKIVNQVYKSITEKTKAAETLKIDGKATSANLSTLLRDVVGLGKQFTDGKVLNNMSGFQKAAVKLLNTKSIVGMGLIIPLAISIQPINRAITRKLSGVKGAPIYKDFTDNKQIKNYNKESLLGEKFKSAGILTGLTVLSSLKMPSLKMFQFEGLFPTMNQCRWISTSTFVSRVFASEDKNELRETTIRDALTFSSLYFLGDYVSKGMATIIEKINPDLKLLNRTVSDKGKGLIGKMTNWIKNTKLKSFDEVTGQTAKNMRSVCQVAHLGVAMLLLGIVFPKMLRKQTEKAREKELLEQQTQTKKMPNDIEKNNIVKPIITKHEAFKNFVK